MVKMPHFETSCLETGVKTLVTETGQQLPPSNEYWIGLKDIKVWIKILDLENN